MRKVKMSSQTPIVIVRPGVDNVAVAVRALDAGQRIVREDIELDVALLEDVPAGHLFTLREIPAGQSIVEYGQPIGVSRGCRAGQWLTPGRIEDRLPDVAHLPCSAVVDVEPLPADQIPTFEGFRRPDGRVGTRNYVLVCPTSMCSSHHAVRIAELTASAPCFANKYPHVDGVIAIPHDKGCGCSDGDNIRGLARTLANMVDHPNVAAAIVIDLGCEKTNLEVFWAIAGGPVRPESKPIETISIQDVGGTEAAIRRGLEVMPKLLDHAEALRRTACSAADLVLATECGGSDGFSGISANPALGCCADLLVRCGGSVILSEVTEICGAEQLLTSRCRTPELADRVLGFSRWFEDLAGKFGQSANMNPSPGNKAGGLINIFQKSLGAVAKAGTTPVEDVLDCAEKVRAKGLTLMQSPGNDPESLGCMIPAGATVCGFTTGRGTTLGNAICPVIKIASNTPMYEHMTADMDVNAGTIVDGAETVEQVGRRIFDLMLAVAGGKRTASERLGHREFQVWAFDRISL
ncbi:MAG: altronate dehydratase [Phycisphaerae bacterium]|nr:altronate dehydratase [Phycisphaerae bacterium]